MNTTSKRTRPAEPDGRIVSAAISRSRSVAGWWVGLLVLAFLTSAVLGCKPPKEERETRRVIATTTMIADLAREIGGDRIEVTSIMEPGGDPHTYQPVPSDSKAVARSELVLINGLMLEGWIEDLVRNAGGDQPVVAVSDGVETLDDPAYEGNPDPHIWFSVPRWKQAAINVRDALIEIDPEGAEGYRERTAAYLEELDALDDWVRSEIGRLPEARRHLVTSHDAFQYFGEEYGVEVMAVQGISTTSEASAAELRDVVDHVREHDIPAIFVESSVNPKLIEQVERETGVEIGGTLHSDSLGPWDGPAGTYVGMVRSNVSTFVEALGPEEKTAQVVR